MSKLIDLTGKRFGRLEVVEKTEKIRGNTTWLCKCDCGNYKPVIYWNLVSGITKSCGCLQQELRMQGRKNIKHGGYGTRLYRIYRGMWERCYNKNVSQYPRYGGRGIHICEEWLGEKGFENFREWASTHGYQDDLSIDRIENEKNYSPDNCRWVSNKTQQNNRRVNVILTYKGEKHTMAEWSDIIGIPRATIKSRHRAGWSDEDIITRPIDKSRSVKKKAI